MFHNTANTTTNSGFTAASPSWTRGEDKLFEDALVNVPEHAPNRWELIALRVPGKSVYDIHRHYEDLVRDVMEIDNGRVELPPYEDVGYECDSGSESAGTHRRSKGKGETERRKGIPWSDEEHRLFLLGLHKYGRGDWRSISRNAVVSRTPTQVASHAQKYFLRLKSKKKEKKRASIHDVTTDEVDTNTIPPNTIGNWATHMTNQSPVGYWPN